MKHTLFFGKSVTSNRLTSRQVTFSRFVTDLKRPEYVGVTEAQYDALSLRDRLTHKDGPYVTPCSFTEPTRQDVYSDKIQILCVDVDDPDHATRLDPFSVDLALSRFNWALHTTMSSREDALRFRIFVEADGAIDSSLYRAAITTLRGVLGLPSLTRESFVAIQPMFLPRCCADSSYRWECGLEGAPFAVADIDAGTPGTDLQTPEDASPDAFVYMVAPLDVSREVVEDALSYVDPDLGRADWIKVGAALKHQFPGELEEEGFAVWDKWSSGGEKYVGEGDTRTNWDSLNADLTHRNPITAKSLFRMARERGWTGAAEEDVLTDLRRRIENTEAPEDLKREIPKAISTTSMDAIDRETLAALLQTRLKEVAGVRISIAAVRKACTYREGVGKVYETERGGFVRGDLAVPQWARGWIYVGATGEFFHPDTRRRMKPDRLDDVFSRHLLSRQDVADGRARPEVLPRDFLLNVVSVPVCEEFTYVPGVEVIVDVDGRKHANLYAEPPRFRRTSNTSLVAAKIEAHLSWLTPTERTKDIVLDFLSYQVQHPGKKINWAILLQGAEGTGKTFLAAMMGTVLGSYNVGTPDTTAIYGSYSDWAEGKQIIFIEEVRNHGVNRHMILDKLKPFITNGTVSINRKYHDVYYIPNCANYMLFTNHRDAVALLEGDRRYCCIFSDIQHRHQIIKRGGAAYFNTLFKLLEESPGAVSEWLGTRKISDTFQPKSWAPDTDDKRALIDLSRSDMEMAVDEAMALEVPGCSPEVLSSGILYDVVQSDGGTASYRYTRQELSRLLARKGYRRVGTSRVKHQGRLHNLWTLKRGRFSVRSLTDTFHKALEDADVVGDPES